MAAIQKVAERRRIQPVDLTKPFGPIESEHDDIRLDVFTCFSAANYLLSAGIDSDCESCKSFSSARTNSAGPTIALSGDLSAYA